MEARRKEEAKREEEAKRKEEARRKEEAKREEEAKRKEEAGLKRTRPLNRAQLELHCSKQVYLDEGYEARIDLLSYGFSPRFTLFVHNRLISHLLAQVRRFKWLFIACLSPFQASHGTRVRKEGAIGALV